MTDNETPAGLRQDARRNRERLVLAAIAAVHREGPQVPLAVIAAEAGVGIGTFYRHFATREDLLTMLTHRSFVQVLSNAVAAEEAGVSPVDSLRLFVEAAISQRNELVLPLHGGPAVSSTATRKVQAEVHATVVRIVEKGIRDASLRPDTRASDVVVLGAMLAQPRPDRDPGWDETCRRLLRTYLSGLSLPT